MSIDSNMDKFISEYTSINDQINSIDKTDKFEEKGKILDAVKQRLNQFETSFKGKIEDKIFQNYSELLNGNWSAAASRLNDISKRHFEISPLKPPLDVEALRKKLRPEVKPGKEESLDILLQAKKFLEDSPDAGKLVKNIAAFIGIAIQNNHDIKVDGELIKLLAFRGFDFSSGEGSTLLLSSKASRELVQMAIFYGANPVDDDYVEQAVLREQVVKKMYPGKEYKNLQFNERVQVFQRCMEINQFRNDWIEPSKITNKKIAHDKFIAAFEAGNYKEASELLKDKNNDIDINGPLIRMDPYGKVPLIVHALFSEKNIEALNFLIDAGADVNVHYRARPDERGPTRYPQKVWLPPIMMAALHEIPNQAEIVELLRNAKADINVNDPVNRRESLIEASRFRNEAIITLKNLPNLIKGGLNPNLLDLWFRSLPKDEGDAARRALTFYGANIEYWRRSDHPYVCRIRDEVLLERSQELRKKQEEIMKEVDAMKRMSSQLIGVVGDFLEEIPSKVAPEKLAEYEKLRNEILSKMTPEERIEFHKRCEEIYKTRPLPPLEKAPVTFTEDDI